MTPEPDPPTDAILFNTESNHWRYVVAQDTYSDNLSSLSSDLLTLDYLVLNYPTHYFGSTPSVQRCIHLVVVKQPRDATG